MIKSSLMNTQILLYILILSIILSGLIRLIVKRKLKDNTKTVSTDELKMAGRLIDNTSDVSDPCINCGGKFEKVGSSEKFNIKVYQCCKCDNKVFNRF